MTFGGGNFRFGRCRQFSCLAKFGVGQALADEHVQRTLGPDFDRKVLKDIILCSHHTHGAVQVGKTGFESVASLDEKRFGVRQFDLDQIHIELRFKLLAIERFDLTLDDASLADCFFCDLHQPPVF